MGPAACTQKNKKNKVRLWGRRRRGGGLLDRPAKRAPEGKSPPAELGAPPVPVFAPAPVGQ